MTIPFDTPIRPTDRLNVAGASGGNTEYYNPNRDVTKIGLEWMRMVAFQLTNAREPGMLSPVYARLLDELTPEQQSEQIAAVQVAWGTMLQDLREKNMTPQEIVAAANFAKVDPNVQLLALALLGEICFCAFVTGTNSTTYSDQKPQQARAMASITEEAFRMADLIRDQWRNDRWYRRGWRLIRSGVRVFCTPFLGAPGTTSSSTSRPPDSPSTGTT